MRKGAFGDLTDDGNCFIKQNGYGSKYSFVMKDDVARIISFIKDPSKG
jgi:hypothetical protein